jgi:lipopolysaccharide biosynthesis glycosyltransferase
MLYSILLDFEGGFADQGLLYHWVKYHRKSYTQIYPEYVEDWGQDKYGNVTMLNVTSNDLPSCLPHKYRRMAKKVRPYRDFVHFTGGRKPWLTRVGRSVLKDAENLQKYPPITFPILWVQTFGKVMKKINVNLTFSEILQRKNLAPLGEFPSLHDAMKHHETFIDRR